MYNLHVYSRVYRLEKNETRMTRPHELRKHVTHILYRI